MHIVFDCSSAHVRPTHKHLLDWSRGDSGRIVVVDYFQIEIYEWQKTRNLDNAHKAKDGRCAAKACWKEMSAWKACHNTCLFVHCVVSMHFDVLNTKIHRFVIAAIH